MEKPVVDEVFEILIQGNLERLNDISRPEDAVNMRIMLSTENSSGAGLTIDIEEITKQAPWITPLFLGPKMHFISASTAIQSAVSGGKSNVLIDWSFSFDSNVAEKVRAYVNHENINSKDKERVLTLLRLKKEYSLQTDLLPFLFENLRLSRNNKSNERPLETIIAFKKLDHINWDAFDENPNIPIFDCDDKAILEDAEITYNNLVNDTEVRKRELRALFTQVILYELAIIWLKKPSSPEEAFKSLVDFCVRQLKKLPKYELLFAWKFLKDPKKIRFFGPLADLSKELTTKSLRGMAWDLSHMRTLETMSTDSNFGSFFLPFFVSFDDKFSEILKNNPIQFLVVDDKLKRMHSAGIDEAEFQITLNKCMSKEVLDEMTREKSEARKSYHLPKVDLEHILGYQTQALERLAEEARKLRGNKKKY